MKIQVKTGVNYSRFFNTIFWFMNSIENIFIFLLLDQLNNLVAIRPLLITLKHYLVSTMVFHGRSAIYSQCFCALNVLGSFMDL